LCLLLLLLNSRAAFAGYCPPDAVEAFESNNTIFLGVVETATDDIAVIRVLKVYKGVIEAPEVKIRFELANGTNCGVLLTAGSTRVIAANRHYWKTEQIQTYFSYGQAIKSFDDPIGHELLTSYALDIESLKSEIHKTKNVMSWNKLLRRQEEAKDYYQAVQTLGQLQKLDPANVDYKARAAFWELWIGKTENAGSIINQLLKDHGDRQSVKQAYYQKLIFDHEGYQTQPDLSDFSDMWMSNIDYSKSHMLHAVFARAYVEKAIFDGAFLENASVHNSTIDASFKRARFSQVAFHDSRIEGDFTGATFKNVTFRRADFSRSKFTNAEVVDVDFAETILNQTDFSNADVRGADFSRASLVEADFTKAVCNKKTKWPAHLDLQIECQH